MSLNAKYENINDTSDNIVPLANSEIKSILKAQSEAVFIEEKKMISKNSSFIKKSLIDLAIEFENKVIETKSENNNNDLENKEIIDSLNEIKNENNDNTLENSEIDKTSIEENLLDKSIVEDKNIKNNIDDVNNSKTNSALELNEIDTGKITLGENLEENNKKIEITEENHNNIIEPSLENTLPIVEETQQALDSVRSAVSKSINNSIDENNNNNLDIDNSKQIDPLIEIKRDIDDFKNIFSALSNLTEKVIHENIENKIIEIASELAGYQIDKMPDKYEKKIKTFLKSINRFEEKMSIETNDKDYEALLKIENFKNINETIKFIPNSDISRGDIILNCDGMHYSEITKKNN